MPINNPSGAFGNSSLDQQLWSEKVPFVAASAISAGYIVSANTLGQVGHAATNGTAALVVGIAAESCSTSGTVLVVTRGYAGQINAQGTIAAGAVLTRSATTAGYVAATATPATGESIGVALAASASSVVPVWVQLGR